jgi:hypothetical protein
MSPAANLGDREASADDQKFMLGLSLAMRLLSQFAHKMFFYLPSPLYAG